MPKIPTTVGDFTVLSIILQSKVLNKDVKHYIYIKAYDPKIPDEESTRSLFLVNIPVTTTESQLRHLFTTQLSGGHIETVYFAEQDGSSNSIIATTKSSASASAEPPGKSQTLGKRKRQSQITIQDLETTLSTTALPSTFPTQFHATGSTAIITFLDRPSRDLTLRAVRKASKPTSPIHPLIWSAPSNSNTQSLPLGTSRYQSNRQLTFPSRSTLLSLTDTFMTTYTQLEQLRSDLSAKKRAEPDEDGFVTVTRGSKGVVKADELEAIKAREEAKRRKNVGLDDFYRFQVRERRRGEREGLEGRFEGDRRRVEEIRRRREG